MFPYCKQTATRPVQANTADRFLLAQIYLSSLDDKPTPKAIRVALNDLQARSSGLADYGKDLVLARAYDQVMERINNQKPGFRDLALDTLAWLSCAKTPLYK